MKIAFLNKYQNKVNRGAETFVYELSKRLSKNNEVDVISNISYSEIFKRKYDIVIPTNGRFQAFVIRIITWLKGSKMVVSGQSGIGFDDKLNLLSFPDIFIGLTSFQSDWAKKFNPFVKVETISNGVDLNIFKGEALKDVRNVIVSAGAFTKEKRHSLTIDAVSKLQKVKLVIVGSGGDLKNEIYTYGLEKLGKERFEVLSVNHEKMSEIFRNANVLAFPSVPWESFGIVLVEAMATGLPVVATNDPIRCEIIGDAGILVDPTDTNKYAKALEKALETKWGDRPRAQAKKFSWDKIAEKYEELFKKILK
jgi:glycosyltransferase involved in cell wall biosynthesis